MRYGPVYLLRMPNSPANVTNKLWLWRDGYAQFNRMRIALDAMPKLRDSCFGLMKGGRMEKLISQHLIDATAGGTYLIA